MIKVFIIFFVSKITKNNIQNTSNHLNEELSFEHLIYLIYRLVKYKT